MGTGYVTKMVLFGGGYRSVVADALRQMGYRDAISLMVDGGPGTPGLPVVRTKGD
jgi:hypothetical protein